MYLYSCCGVTALEFVISFLSYTKDFWVFYGINTEMFQCGCEFKSKTPFAIPWRFTAKINVPEKKFEFDFPPCKKELELFSMRCVCFTCAKDLFNPKRSIPMCHS